VKERRKKKGEMGFCTPKIIEPKPLCLPPCSLFGRVELCIKEVYFYIAWGSNKMGELVSLRLGGGRQV
jgi:hypothetical protein